MPKDYIQISLGLQKFSVLGWQEDKSGVMVEVIKTLSYGVCPQCMAYGYRNFSNQHLRILARTV